MGEVVLIGAAANTYEVLAKLAVGGMAEIFLARSKGIAGVERYCVMKRILREHSDDVRFVQMFLDEARLVARLQHANIAQVYDLGKLGDSYFFTMEYVHGETIRGVAARAERLRKPLPLGCVFTIAAGVAAGLHHAHERLGANDRPLGIVHRDVSPSNVMVGFDGIIKLVDFGVAKADDRAQETRAGTVKGKISYLSPEQARGMPLDRRTDLFALGIVMWEMLTLRRLYGRDSDFETMTAIVNEPPPPPSSLRPDLPPEVDRLVLKALAKAPADRFQTAEELAEAIEVVGERLRAAPSPAMLARYLRELFGARKEAWRTLSPPATPADRVTMTAEPVPERITVSLRGPADPRLEAVPVIGAASASAPVAQAIDAADAPVTATRRSWIRRGLRSPIAILSALLVVSATIAVVIAATPGAAKVPEVAPAPASHAVGIEAPEPTIEATIDAAVAVDAAMPTAVPVDAGTAPDAGPRPAHKGPHSHPAGEPRAKPLAIDCKKDPMACP